eukprot:TRINITY_DN48798_c0_g1_i1.p1 TRINITY_DN48798_c0_g1~~TRINITY_DN48798_c0_g1_i1.p1  ORF type:complete len:548 (-),score=109.38 TRINITY_DN48798_c0_g1_i1:43-1686(-)
MDVWLAEALKRERQELERRHHKLLIDFAARFDSSRAVVSKSADSEVTIDPDLVEMSLVREDACILPPEDDEEQHPNPDRQPSHLQSESSFQKESSLVQSQQGNHPTLMQSQHFSSSKIPHYSVSQSSVAFGSKPSLGSEKSIASEDQTWGNKLLDVFGYCLVIIGVTLVACEIEYVGLQRGHEIEYGSYTVPAAEVWPLAETVFAQLDWILGVLLCLELFLNMAVQRLKFFKDLWNWIDVIVVVLWVLDKALTSEIPVDPMLLRLARLSRIVKSLRLIQSIKAFDHLFVMTTSIQSSLSILAWSFLLLFVMLFILGLLINQAMVLYIADKNIPLGTRKELFKYFGTCTRALLTMFEITLANWAPVARILQEGCGEYWILFSIVHKMSIGLAVVGVINGIFVQETFKVASSDDRIMQMRKNREKETHRRKMRSFFASADSDDDNMVSWPEFREALRIRGVRDWLAAQDLDISEPKCLWYLLAGDGGAELSMEDFVSKIGKLRGTATRADVLYLMAKLDEVIGQQMTDNRLTSSLVSQACQGSETKVSM